MAVARAGSERKLKRRRTAERRLGLLPDEPLATGLQRMALAQSDLAIDALRSRNDANGEQSVHEARKAIKRLRTIVRLLDGQLPRRSAAREQASLREAATHLAGARDAAVMLATLEALVQRDERRLRGRRGVGRLRAHLAAQRDEAELRIAGPGRAQAIIAMQGFRWHAQAWPLHDQEGLATVELGLLRIYRQGRRRRRRAARRGGGATRPMHRWRKRVKDLRYAAETLRRLELEERRAKGHGHGRGAAADRRSGWLAKLATEADDLGEVLGEEHDLAMLAEWLQGADAKALAGSRTRRRLLQQIAARRRKLRRRALKSGSRLYKRSSGDFIERAAKATKRAPRLS